MSAVVSRQKLAAVLARLESPYDGERAAAGLLAARMVRQAGISWEELLSGAAPPRPRQHWRETIAELLAQPAALRTWEAGFLESLQHFPRLSPKQASVLRQIAERVLQERAA